MTEIIVNRKFPWPPAFLIRYSRRAKHISMRILPEEGLEVVLPEGRTEREAFDFLDEHRDWIIKHGDALHPENLEFGVNRYALPERINLRCIKRIFRVQYRQRSISKVLLHQPKPTLLIFEGRIKDFRCCEVVFHAWLKKQAEEHLIPMLDRKSKKTKLVYRHVAIRHQSTRWASCSELGDIKLNMEMLFLPAELTRYLLIHELCHLKVFDHSKRFWKLVEKFDPNYERKRRRLRDIA
ncbi:MAG: hypothetical protein COB66_06025 [Coxiella sp. (in: Bacteria)]|nr:MAG: hypothetical protein COB66_06025 [Coxiella sp. (in: g-proteobacteria)]